VLHAAASKQRKHRQGRLCDAYMRLVLRPIARAGQPDVLGITDERLSLGQTSTGHDVSVALTMPLA